MAITECANGHLYDTDQYAACPYCNGGGNVIQFNQAPPVGGIGKTAPVGEGFGSFAENSGQSSNIGKTVAPESYRKKQRESNKTVGILGRSMTREPVVGWLVCIEGADKGKDYKIYAKNNTIGRSEQMDICIQGDMTISRENHARLTYDEKHNNFYLIPAESMNNIYLNDEPIYVPNKISAYDCIEFGDSKMVFIPFCTEKFTWKGGLRQNQAAEE